MTPSYSDYPYLVIDLRAAKLKCEPVVGYFETRQNAQQNADLRNKHVHDPYGMPRYIVYEVNDWE